MFPQMTEWYYSSGGKQNGPVSFEKLVEIARSGALDPVKDLVWNASMKDWQPADKFPEIFANPTAVSDPSNPYAAPETTWTGDISRSIPAGEALVDIVPGSEPIDIGGCVKRGFDLTCRHFGMLLIIGIIYVAISIAAEAALAFMDSALGWGHGETEVIQGPGSVNWQYRQSGSPLNIILTQILSTFLSLGLSRIGLNVVSGKEFSVGMLFGQGKKLLPAFLGMLLFGLMFVLGLLLLIAPGIYLLVRYGFFMTAMVDRNLGLMDAFKYSSSITTNNRMNLFLLGLLAILIVLAGCLALCVGMFFAIPVMWLSWTVAYRWMQYGHRAALDHPGTKTPMLAPTA